MTEKKKDFLRHAAIYGIGSLLVQAASVILLPLYTHHLLPSEYGVLQLVYRVGEVLNICLMVAGVRMATLTFFAQAEQDRLRERVAASVTLFLLLVISVSGVLVLCVSKPLGRLLLIEDTRLLTFGVFAAVLEILTVMPLALMQARVESGYYALASVGMFITRVSLSVALVVFFHFGIWGVLAANSLTAIIFGTALIGRELHLGSLKPDFSQLRDILKFALPFVPGGICFFVLHNGDQFFLVRTAGPNELGIYVLAYRLSTAVGMFAVLPFYQVWSAKMFQVAKSGDAGVVFGRIITGILGCYIFLGTGLVIFRNEVLFFLGSEAYLRATLMVGPLVLAYFFLNASNLMDAGFYVTRRTDLKPWIALASATVMISMYAVLIPRFGAIGAAVATLIGFAGHAGFTLVVSQSVFPVQYEFARLASMLILGIGLAGSTYPLEIGLLGTFGKALAWMSWPVVLWALHIIRPDEKAQCVYQVRAWIQLIQTKMA